jgi:hypothetical protein
MPARGHNHKEEVEMSEHPKMNYAVDTIRSGQPRAYADTEREFLITVTRTHWKTGEMAPWVMFGDVEKQIVRDEAERKAGRMSGGQSPEQLRAGQRDWAKKIVRVLCQNFREKGDDDGQVEGSECAYFYPTLKTLKIDASAGRSAFSSSSPLPTDAPRSPHNPLRRRLCRCRLCGLVVCRRAAGTPAMTRYAIEVGAGAMAGEVEIEANSEREARQKLMRGNACLRPSDIIRVRPMGRAIPKRKSGEARE